MRIRLQIILTLMPVFVFLGAVLATLNYFTRRGEIEFACQEEVYATTVALAEFLGCEEVRRHLAGGGRSPVFFSTPLRRVMAANPIGSVTIRDIEDGAPIWSVGEVLISTLPTGTEEGLLKAKGNVLYSGPVESGRGADGWIVAFAPLVTGEGPFALLSVEIDGSWVLRAKRSILVDSAGFFIATLLLGLLATGLTGKLIASSVKELRAATKLVAEGRYGLRVEPGFLGEFNDLSNTFNTMTSLLDELLLRMKRAVIEVEQFRKPADLAARFGEYLWKQGASRLGKFRLLAMRFGDRPNGDFLEIWNQGGTVRIVMGRILSSGEMDSAVTASAALRLVDEEIRCGGAGFGRASEVFHFKFWNLIVWSEGASDLEVLSYRFGQAVESRHRVPVSRSQPLSWHSLQGDGARRLKLILEAFGVFREEELIQGLSAILGEPSEGGVLLLVSD